MIEYVGGTAAENPHHGDRLVVVTERMARACSNAPDPDLRRLWRRYVDSPNIAVDDLAVALLVRYKHD